MRFHTMLGSILILGLTGAAGCPAADTAAGKVVFERWCAGCHAPLSERKTILAGTHVLGERYKGSRPAALEERTDLTRAFVKQIVRSGLNIMPPARKTEISDRDLDALADYLAKQ